MLKSVKMWSGLPYVCYTGAQTQDWGMVELRLGQPGEVLAQTGAEFAATGREQAAKQWEQLQD